MNHPPRTLNELLDDFSIPTTDTGHDVDAAIANNMWARRFRDYLRKRDLEDEENAFKFLITTQPLKRKSEQATQKGKNNNNTTAAASARKQRVRQDMEDVYFHTVREFFDEESETVVCLANATHFSKICERAAELEQQQQQRSNNKKETSLKDEDIELLLRARDDMDVWQNGVEPTFMKFLAQAGMSPMACLLSIL